MLAAGGIGTGGQIAAALALGCQGVWAGSLWLTVEEADLPPAQKQQLPRRRLARHRARSRSFTGKPCRMLKNDWTEAWERPDTPDPLGMPLQYMVSGNCVARGHRYADQAGDVPFNPVGQVVGQFKTVEKTAPVIQRLVEEYLEATGRLDALAGGLIRREPDTGQVDDPVIGDATGRVGARRRGRGRRRLPRRGAGRARRRHGVGPSAARRSSSGRRQARSRGPRCGPGCPRPTSSPEPRTGRCRPRGSGSCAGSDRSPALRRCGRPASPAPAADLAATLARAARRPWAARPTALAAALLPEGTVSTDMISEGIGALLPDAWPRRPAVDLRGAAVGRPPRRVRAG